MASTSTSGHSKPEPAIVRRYNDSIYAFHIPDGDPKAEIIFFHDIEWEKCEEPHVQTWMSSTNPPVCWPKAWLSVEYPEARILSARYDAGTRKDETRGRMKLHLLAENLRQDILSVYENKDILSIYENSRPVFMVGHGLGGLVIKELIRNLQKRRADLDRHGTHKDLVRKLDCFLKNVRGVLYYSTPCWGTKLADTRKDFPNSGSMWAHLKIHKARTGRLNEWFKDWRIASKCRASAIFSILPTNLPWDGHVVEEARHVVVEASARYDVDTFYTAQANHFDACKPDSRIDKRFCILKELIHPEMQGPVAHVGCSDERECIEHVKRECIEHVNHIVEGLKGQAQFLNRDILEKIDKFPELSGNLRDRLKAAGYVKTDENANLESWEKLILVGPLTSAKLEIHL